MTHIPPLPTHTTPTQKKEEGEKKEWRGKGSARPQAPHPVSPMAPGSSILYIHGETHRQTPPKDKIIINHRENTRPT